MAGNTVYLIFHGFPGDLDLKKKTWSKSDRTYSGVHPQTRGWKPGEIRALTDESHPKKPDELIFSAEGTAEALLRDYGAESDAFEHYPKKRTKIGFEASTKADYDAARKKKK